MSLDFDLDLTTVRRALGEHAPVSLDDSESPKRAAVAAVLRESPRGPEVLFMRRAEHPTDPWSGHMAFPGGRKEDHDDDLLRTAIRETEEEVGLDLARHGEYVGRLDDLEAIARSKRVGMVIRPHVFLVGPEITLSPNHEVAELVWAPLRPMLSGEISTTHRYEREGYQLDLPAYDVDGRIVWGLTHRMLSDFFSVIRSDSGR